MEVNLSAETIGTVYYSLVCSKQSLKQQLRVKGLKMSSNVKEIITHQLEEVEDALFVFEELIDRV